MKKKIAVIHTSLAIVETVDRQIRKILPDADIYNIIDQKMLGDVMEQGGIDTGIINRMCLYIKAAEAIEADIILNACSSVGEAFETARKLTDIPTVKIDEPMAKKVAKKYSRIAVYGTVPTTLQPSGRLIEHMAENMGKEVCVTTYLAEGAFQALTEEKDPERHNQLVLAEIMKTYKNHDAIVLAQASMTVLLPMLKTLEVPVFYSLQSGIEYVAMCLL